MRFSSGVLLALLACSCGNQQRPLAEKKPAPRPKITQFYASDPMIPRGLTGKLCYGVESASKVELNPPVETLWPSMARCFEISPVKKTTYTLTARGDDGSKDTKTVEVTVGAPPPRLYDLWVNSVNVHPGDDVTVCFKVENVKSVKAGPGRLDRNKNCLSDKPKKTTTYKITAYGGDNEIDSGTVTVKVR